MAKNRHESAGFLLLAFAVQPSDVAGNIFYKIAKEMEYPNFISEIRKIWKYQKSVYFMEYIQNPEAWFIRGKTI